MNASTKAKVLDELRTISPEERKAIIDVLVRCEDFPTRLYSEEWDVDWQQRCMGAYRRWEIDFFQRDPNTIPGKREIDHQLWKFYNLKAATLMVSLGLHLTEQRRLGRRNADPLDRSKQLGPFEKDIDQKEAALTVFINDFTELLQKSRKPPP